MIVEDDLSTQHSFKAAMEKAGYIVVLASNVPEAAALLEIQEFNLAIVALKLHSVTGFDLVRRIPDLQPGCAIVMTSSNPSTEALLEALRTGVADFLITPVSDDLLRRNVGEALLKHPTRQLTKPEFVVGALRIDSGRRTAYWHEQALTLTPTEFCILLMLAQQTNQIIPASVMIHRCRDYSIGEQDARQLIKPHIAHLREKLEQDGRYKRVLLNHRGRGFVLKPE